MNNYLVAAYGVIWVVLLVYVFVLARKYTRIHKELEELKRQLEHDRK